MEPVRAPTRRECESCGRIEVWDTETWRVAVEDGTRQVGVPYCIHEWDITGEFSPVVDPDTSQ